MASRATAVLLVLVAVAVAPSTARADERGDWYGWQTLSIDAVAIGGAVAAGATRHSPSLMVATTAYVLGGPALHLAHERGLGVAGQSVGARILLPAVGAFGGMLVGYAASRAPDDDALQIVSKWVMVGLAVGVVAASAYDAGWLAYDDAADGEPRRRVLSFGGSF